MTVWLTLILALSFCANYALGAPMCYGEYSENESVFSVLGSILTVGQQNPQSCMIDCQKQGLLRNQTDPMFFAVSKRNFCMCGFNLDPGVFAKDPPNVCDPSANTWVCPDAINPSADFCGSIMNEDYFTFYDSSTFPTNPTDKADFNITDTSGTIVYNGGDINIISYLTGQTEIFVDLRFGGSSYSCNPINIYGIKCLGSATILPPVEIAIDYGDGSKYPVWTSANPRNIWRHSYFFSGNYPVSISVKNTYDHLIERVTTNVSVVTFNMDKNYNIECPSVVLPGSYFSCKIWMFNSESEVIKVDLWDRETNLPEDTTGWIRVPEKFAMIPGGKFPNADIDYANHVLTDTTIQAIVITSSRFPFAGNVTALLITIPSRTVYAEVVFPICATGQVYCSLTDGCETKCMAGFEVDALTPDYYHACEGNSFCSNEESCQPKVVKPDSFAGKPGPTAPIAYQVLHTLQQFDQAGDLVSETFSGSAEGKEQVFPIRLPKYKDPATMQIVYNTSYHKTFPLGSRLAIRCNGLCPQIPWMETSEIESDFAVIYENGMYHSPTQFPTPRTHAGRVVLAEFRDLFLEKKFFCDRAAEKTATLTINRTTEYSNLPGDTPYELSVESGRISCEYPIMEIQDLSPSHPNNVNNNSWNILTFYPTKDQILTMDKDTPKKYEASLWVKKDESITFAVNISSGSHLRVTWSMDSDTDHCKGVGGEPCLFPFKNDNKMYYGCTPDNNQCSIDNDEFYNRRTLADCSDFCHKQVARVDNLLIKNTANLQGGTQVLDSDEYIAPFSTQLELKRTFTSPGKTYIITLEVQNLHTKRDTSILTWEVMCGNPVLSSDWEMEFNRFIRPGDTVSIKMWTLVDVPLPTMPILRIVHLEGDQVLESTVTIDNTSIIPFFLTHDLATPIENCFENPSICVTEATFENMGVEPNTLSGSVDVLGRPALGSTYGNAIIATVAFNSKTSLGGSHGFSIQFFNGISKIWEAFPSANPAMTYIQVLDPAPHGSGDWVGILSPKWQKNWVESFAKIEGPVLVKLQYSLIGSSQLYNAEFYDKIWYIPAASIPQFTVSIYKGTVRRVQYTMNNTDPGGIQPLPCLMDWPQGALTGSTSWEIKHCSNVSEGTYESVASVFNPLDGWISSPVMTIEVLEETGPIDIQDGSVITDMGEPRNITVTLANAGKRTCVVIDYGDGSSYEYFGNNETCAIRFPMESAEVKDFDLDSKVILVQHIYMLRGVYDVSVYAFDKRHYSEAEASVTVFRLPCSPPVVYLPVNQTSFERWERIPEYKRSVSFQYSGYASVECNVTTSTWMEWRIYSVRLVRDELSQAAMKEELEQIQINTSIPSYNQLLITIPPRTLRQGLYKLVFHFEVETGIEEILVFKEGFTYINITASPLKAVIIEGSPTKISRGWGQTLDMNPIDLSSDPDNPLEKAMNFTWYCRVIAPEIEEYKYLTSSGFPDESKYPGQKIPAPSEANFISPSPGCFGNGPVRLATRAGRLSINTTSFETYSRIYEIMIVISKGERAAKAKIELEVGEIPAPVSEISCLSQSLCFPTFEGVYVNPTSRIAFLGNCVGLCEGDDLHYEWNIKTSQVNVTIITNYCGLETNEGSLLGTSTLGTTTTQTTTTTTLTDPIEISEVYTTVFLMNSAIFASSQLTTPNDNIPYSITSTTFHNQTEQLKKRKKRETIQLNEGCSWVFGGGQTEARFNKELSLQEIFFQLQDSNLREFQLSLKITKTVTVLKKALQASGYAEYTIKINDPPVNGTCKMLAKSLATGDWVDTSAGLALVQQFKVDCDSKWNDPNGHKITKYTFKTETMTVGKPETVILSSGPLKEISAVFPIGSFKIYAEIHDEAGAFAIYVLKEKLDILIPDKAEYDAFDFPAKVLAAKTNGNKNLLSQMLSADASIKKEACWFNITCTMASTFGSFSKSDNLTESELDAYNDLMRGFIISNTEALAIAADSTFDTLDQLKQGASTLQSIVSSTVPKDGSGTTLDRDGRNIAVAIMEKMAKAFGDVEVPDPNKITDFIESTTGSMVAVFESLNKILYANDPSELPITDFEAASSLPYDTDIPGPDAEIPENPEIALAENAMKITRLDAVEQVKKMIHLVDDIAATTIRNSVIGEELRTSSKLGAKMIIAKVGGFSTIGIDTNGDGRPDIPLRYELDDSASVVQFPLGFCPSNPNGIDMGCKGSYGIVIKEWEVITRIYPATSKYLNKVTKQIDVDVLDNNGEKIKIADLKADIDILIQRMKYKDPLAVTIPDNFNIVVNTEDRLNALKIRNKMPMIYHSFNVSSGFATITLQIKLVYEKIEGVEIPDLFQPEPTLVLLLRKEKLPTLDNCDFIHSLSSVKARDEDNFYELFIPKIMQENTLGQWYLGIVSLESLEKLSDIVEDGNPCKANLITRVMLSWNFEPKVYQLRIFTGGAYFFNEATENWEVGGISVLNTTNIMTGLKTNHLTSFATGFSPQPNSLDFTLIFAKHDFKDVVTIFMLLILCFLVYFIGMIWATIQDLKDNNALSLIFLEDNHPDDKYMYEIVVETGPKDNHATTSKIGFELIGELADTGARTFNEPTKTLFKYHNVKVPFKKGSIDSFLMTTESPLGDLNYLRVWTDSSGLGEMSAWYLLSIQITDVQTGMHNIFVADQWLAIDRGTFEDDISLPAMSLDDEYSKDFLLKSGYNHQIKDDHVWWSAFTRPIRSRFTRKQRVTVCMATVMLTIMTTGMYYDGRPGTILNPLGTLGPIGFDARDMFIGLISSLIVLPPTILLVTIFKKGRWFSKRKNRVDKTIEEATKAGKIAWKTQPYKRVTSHSRLDKSWPPFVIIGGWLLAFICIMGGSFVVFSYGVTFGNDKSYQWVVSIITSFFTSMIVIQPLKVAIIIAIFAYCCRKVPQDDDHVDIDEDEPLLYFDPKDPTITLRNKREKQEAQTMEGDFFYSLKHRKNEEQEMKSLLRDIAIYFCYVLVVFIITYGNRDFNAFLQKEAIKTAVINGGLTCGVGDPDDLRYKECNPEDVSHPEVDFMKIKHVNDWFYWLNNTVKPNVRVQDWYNGQPPYGLRGYLEDRSNRIIGYAIVRQVRQAHGTCKTPRIIRDNIEHCTGTGGVEDEDSLDYCVGWTIKSPASPCEEESEEYIFQSSSELESLPISAEVRTYGGGGYLFKFTGEIQDLEAKLDRLVSDKWVDNRTRALILEFSVYNAHVNLFGSVTAVAEFVGGGIVPWARVESVRLFNTLQGFGYIVLLSETLFAFSTFYYFVNVLATLKKEGWSQFCANSWNLSDVFTLVMSITALILYGVRSLVVRNVVQKIGETKGNIYIRLTYALLVNEYYSYVVAFTVFTSTLKFSKMIAFHKAFMQIAASLKLCFQGLSTFVVEFAIVFIAFSSFFYFVLKNDLDNFRDESHTLEYTLAMSIGKFNFSALRQADELAAWIFFVFSITVNMILINMMMAIINLSFEEIKQSAAQYENKFELLDYVKRTGKEMIGVKLAEPIKPVYKGSQTGEEEDQIESEETKMDKFCADFSLKTDLLLKYVETTYLNGELDEETSSYIRKMQQNESKKTSDKKVVEYGFDAIFLSESNNH